MASVDAVVVGSGPNGLTAAAILADAGLHVRVFEAADEVGGGLRTEQLTLPGFRHDVCSAVHTLGGVSPVFRELELSRHGLSWCHPKASVAHPLSGQPAVVLQSSLERTARELSGDSAAYRRLLEPLLRHPEDLVLDLLAPLRIPRRPLALARFGLLGVGSAEGLIRRRFSGDAAAALLAGCAAHGVQPLDRPLTAAFCLTFLAVGHMHDWPVARGGSSSIARALANVCTSHGVEIELGQHITSLAQLPPARAYLFDLAPAQLARLEGARLPASYRRRLLKYRMGPGCFKVDWALSEPIPWEDPRCSLASTVHVGGSAQEIARAESEVWSGGHPERPFVLVTQQSLFDSSRAPSGRHTGYAYCHVPAGSTFDYCERIESQIERYAPGFRDTILARHVLPPAALEAKNPSHIGGVFTGGVADLGQLFTRPVARFDPYTTPDPRLFLCSHSTPPGGGVHGMCGFYAAKSALARRFDIQAPPLAPPVLVASPAAPPSLAP